MLRVLLGGCSHAFFFLYKMCDIVDQQWHKRKKNISPPPPSHHDIESTVEPHPVRGRRTSWGGGRRRNGGGDVCTGVSLLRLRRGIPCHGVPVSRSLLRYWRPRELSSCFGSGPSSPASVSNAEKPFFPRADPLALATDPAPFSPEMQ